MFPSLIWPRAVFYFSPDMFTNGPICSEIRFVCKDLASGCPSGPRMVLTRADFFLRKSSTWPFMEHLLLFLQTTNKLNVLSPILDMKKI
ncbi:hypothetical protein BpHYR1_034782 [Brachionus plicatilis]|uniref:Uncharacterized protein n=1 Tax=Brachionus plicatilis TaxID=10195 RepID=A0A3M7S1W6_BRAPC|nr:hypothetical protein BpHYR1_034782 [Brachionus plicatilis]